MQENDLIAVDGNKPNKDFYPSPSSLGLASVFLLSWLALVKQKQEILGNTSMKIIMKKTLMIFSDYVTTAINFT